MLTFKIVFKWVPMKAGTERNGTEPIRVRACLEIACFFYLFGFYIKFYTQCRYFALRVPVQPILAHRYNTRNWIGN